jgi:hypothetical protein
VLTKNTGIRNPKPIASSLPLSTSWEAGDSPVRRTMIPARKAPRMVANPPPDHHTKSDRFLAHLGKEAQHGRRCPAEWSWIVPPTAGSTTPVFHRYYDDFEASPNFGRHDS